MNTLSQRLVLENKILDKLGIPFVIKDAIFKRRVPLTQFIQICQSDPTSLDICPNNYGLNTLCKEVLITNGFSKSVPNDACTLMNTLVEMTDEINNYNGDTFSSNSIDKKLLTDIIINYKFYLLFGDNDYIRNFLLDNSTLNLNSSDNAVRLLDLVNLLIAEIIAESNGEPLPIERTSLDEINTFLKTHWVTSETKDAFVDRLFSDLINSYEIINRARIMSHLTEEEVERNKNALEKQEYLITMLVKRGGDIKNLIRNAVQLNMINLVYKLILDRRLGGYALRESLKMRRGEITDMILSEFIDYSRFTLNNYPQMKIGEADDIQNFISQFVSLEFIREDSFFEKIHEIFFSNLLKRGDEKMIIALLEHLNSTNELLDLMFLDEPTQLKLKNISKKMGFTNLLTVLDVE